MPWESSVDIWAAGVLIWSMLERNLVFGEKGTGDESAGGFYLSQMTGILGPPPLDFLTEHKACRQYWDETGVWKVVDGIEVRAVTLEEKASSFAGDEAAQFADFMRSMPGWKPGERSTARQLLAHPFLRVEPRQVGNGHSDGDRGPGTRQKNQDAADPEGRGSADDSEDEQVGDTELESG